MKSRFGQLKTYLFICFAALRFVKIELISVISYVGPTGDASGALRFSAAHASTRAESPRERRLEFLYSSAPLLSFPFPSPISTARLFPYLFRTRSSQPATPSLSLHQRRRSPSCFPHQRRRSPYPLAALSRRPAPYPWRSALRRPSPDGRRPTLAVCASAMVPSHCPPHSRWHPFHGERRPLGGITLFSGLQQWHPLPVAPWWRHPSRCAYIYLFI